MKLYIQQRVFSIGDKYDVYDEMQNVIYMVQGKIFSIGAQISISDAAGRELYFIKQRITFLLAHYELYQGNHLMADVRSELAIFKPKLSVTSQFGDFTMVGDIFSMDFEILKNGSSIGRISKKWLSWGDSYELDIYDNCDPGFFVALVVTIDNCLHNENH